MKQLLGFDPQLPDLWLAFDPRAVPQLFEQRWPHSITGGAPLTISRCRLQDTKYQPGVRCVVTYELLVEQPQAVWPTIGVAEVQADGIALRLFDDDPRLPWLAEASDPQAMRGRFAALLGANNAATSIDSCTITPVRYKPGARCVFRYDLQSSSGAQTFFGKLLAEGGERLMATINALYEASRLAPNMPGILPPLAYWHDVRMLVQPSVAGGVELNERAFDPAHDEDARERLISEAGARLAGLHTSAAAPGPLRSLDDDLDELREYVPPMMMVDRMLAARYEALITAVGAAGAAKPESEAVASHGAFRTDQFMIEDGQLVLIDLDGFCWASPARDVGNFLAYLAWKTIRRPQQRSFVERAGAAFLEGYAAARPALDLRWVAIYQAASMLKIAGRRFRSLSFKEWPLVPQLLEAAAARI